MLLLIRLQAQENTFDVGVKGQWYPAGLIYGIQIEYQFKPHHGLHVLVGYNDTDRKDFSGLNDNEEGGGPGFSVGYRYYLKEDNSGFFGGVRTDFWFMDIDWMDANSTPTTGTTTITVFQPTFEMGYQLLINEKTTLGAFLGLGREINIVSNGEDVGQGGITLIGINLGMRF